MTEVKMDTQIIEPRRGGTLLFLFAFLVLLAVAGLTLYLNMQKTALTEEQDRIRVEVTGLNNEIMALQAQNVEGARIAQDWLEKIKEDEIRWSTVIDAIWELVPKDDVTGKPLVKILSYSGTSGGKISLNVDTTGERVNTFANVAKLIGAFNATTSFSNAYVPSIARGEDEEGDIQLSFGMNVTYLGEQYGSLSELAAGAATAGDDAATAGGDEAATGDEAGDAAATGVSRTAQ